MEPYETVLSDVHVSYDSSVIEKLPSINVNHPEHCVSNEITVVVSKIVCRSRKTQSVTVGEPELDEDGDLDVIRAPQDRWETISLEHSLATPLSHVGLQVWNGALLLGDYIFHESERWKNQTVLELGSGTGLCSILLGMYAKTVYCTATIAKFLAVVSTSILRLIGLMEGGRETIQLYVGEDVLGLCLRNVKRNLHVIPQSFKDNPDGEVIVRELDWFQDNPLNFTFKGRWGWQLEDVDRLGGVANVFASDVIYNEELTDAFFETLRKIMPKNSSCCLYLSLEKRLNFTLTDLEVAAPAYKHFRQKLDVLLNSDSKWSAKQTRTDFPQCFQYDRSKYLELWEICFNY